MLSGILNSKRKGTMSIGVMEKGEARRMARAYLSGLTGSDVTRKSEAISARLCAHQIWKRSGIILCYVAFDREVETRIIMETALAEGKRVGVPRIIGENLVFHELSGLDGRFVRHAYGIDEPMADSPVLDHTGWNRADTLVIAPGLAFDRKGGRVGRGRGFYDRFLETVRTRVSVTGVCFSGQLVSALRTEPHDIRTDYVVTESEFLSVGTG